MNGGQLNRRGLTIKQAKFVKHYAETNGNGTESAKRAGYSAHRDPTDPATLKTLSVVAAENLARPRVQSALQSTMSKALSTDEILTRLTEIANKSPEFKGSDTMKALELLGRNQKMFTDKIETSSPQDELKAQIIQDLAQKYQLTEIQAKSIMAEVYGEESSDSVN